MGNFTMSQIFGYDVARRPSAPNHPAAPQPVSVAAPVPAYSVAPQPAPVRYEAPAPVNIPRTEKAPAHFEAPVNIPRTTQNASTPIDIETAEVIIDADSEYMRWTQRGRDLIALGKVYEDKTIISEEFHAWCIEFESAMLHAPASIFRNEALVASEKLTGSTPDAAKKRAGKHLR